MENQSPLTVFNLQDLFSAPLQATIDADFEAARQFVRYIRRFGFQPSPQSAANKGDDWGGLRMVAFGVERDRNGFPNTEVIRIPTLSMIPLPLLEVREADFRFAVRILTRERVTSPPHGLFTGGEPPEDDPEAFRWRAMLSEERGEHGEIRPSVNPQLAANMLVNVKVRRGDVPAGIASLIALMNENSQVIHDLIQLSPRSATLSEDAPRTDVAIRMLGLNGESLPGGKLVAHYRDDLGFGLQSGGYPWRPGEQRTVDDSGRIAASLVLEEPHAASATGAIRFEAVEQGFPASQELSVLIRCNEGKRP